MATFAQIQSAVSGRLLDPSNTAVSAADVATAINQSIAFWKFRRFWFNEVRDTSLLLTPQDSALPLPADFLVPSKDEGAFEVYYSNMRYVMRKDDTVTYDAAWLGNGFGIPRVYSRLASHGYRCYPLPDKAYNLIVYYLKEYPALVNAADTNDFTVNADRLITLWTLADLMAEFRQDDEMESYYRKRATTEYQNLLLMTGKSNAAGSLTLTSSLL